MRVCVFVCVCVCVCVCAHAQANSGKMKTINFYELQLVRQSDGGGVCIGGLVCEMRR